MSQANQNLANIEEDMRMLAEQNASKPLDALHQDMEMLVRAVFFSNLIKELLWLKIGSPK